MLFAIAFFIVILWALGAFIIPVGSGLIHLLLVIALIAILYELLVNRRSGGGTL